MYHCTIDADFWHRIIETQPRLGGFSCSNVEIGVRKYKPNGLLYCRWNDTQPPPTDSFYALVAFICFRKTFSLLLLLLLLLCVHCKRVAKTFSRIFHFWHWRVCSRQYCVVSVYVIVSILYVRDGKVNMHVFAVLLCCVWWKWWHILLHHHHFAYSMCRTKCTRG